MGQAKLRGTKEQRIAEAIKRKHEQLGLEHIPIETIYAQHNLPPTAVPLGYIVRIDFSAIETMQFLVEVKEYGDGRDFSYSHYPGNACLFEDFEQLKNIARYIATTHETDICFLFETDKQFEVVPVITLDSPTLLEVS